MTHQFVYEAMPLAEAAGLYALLVAASLAAGWLFFYKLGQVLLALAFPEWRTSELRAPLALLTGLWAFPSLVLAAGLTGSYTLVFLGLCGAAILGAGIYERIPLLSRPRLDVLRASPFAVVTGLGVCLLLSFMAVEHMTPWFDGNYPVAGGHLARTGFYLVANSDGQPGMVTLVALVNVLLPHLSPLTASLGWGPLYVAVLYAGLVLVLRELFGRGRWEALALLVFLFPVGFKIHEIRGSIAGFVLLTWTLLFVLRLLRTGARLDLVGAVVTLSAGWNFGQLGALYFFALLGVWVAGEFLTGERARAQSLMRVLFWTNVIEWCHLLVAFRWAMGASAPVWKYGAPGTLTLLLAAAAVWALPRIPAPRLSRRWLLLPFLAIVALAYWKNPVGAPTYAWYFFTQKPDFLFFNFGAYGLLGWVFAVALLVALDDIATAPKQRGAWVVWLAFTVSCLMQWVGAVYAEKGTFPVGEPAGAWDVWKDTTLYWANTYMVIATAYLADRLARAWPLVRRALTPAVTGALALAATLLCLQTTAPYRVLASGGSARDVMQAHLAGHVDVPWMGAQLYSFPAWAYYALADDWMSKHPQRRVDCRYCTPQAFGFVDNQWAVFDFLAGSRLAPRDTFVTGDSAFTYEVYLNRQVRYRSGVNTVSPIYIDYMNDITAHQYYWLPGQRIRRATAGMAYTVVNPKANLHWLTPRLDADGVLRASFDVAEAGAYEVYRGDEMAAAPALASIDAAPLVNDDGSPALGHVEVTAGGHTLELRSADSAPLDPAVPVVLYERRYWDYESAVFDTKAPIFGALGIMRSTGVPNAEITVEDLRTLMQDADATHRAAVLDRYHVRFVILDPLLRMLYPDADTLLSSDPSLERHLLNNDAVFVRRFN